LSFFPVAALLREDTKAGKVVESNVVCGREKIACCREERNLGILVLESYLILSKLEAKAFVFDHSDPS
jgi:hypothetical protein